MSIKCKTNAILNSYKTRFTVTFITVITILWTKIIKKKRYYRAIDCLVDLSDNYLI